MDPKEVNEMDSRMVKAINEKNLYEFIQIIKSGYEVSRRINKESLVQHVARVGFEGALRHLLAPTIPCSPLALAPTVPCRPPALAPRAPCPLRPKDVLRAYKASIKSNAPRTIITVFVDASISGYMRVINLPDCYRYAMEWQSSRLARRVVEAAEFDPNCCIQMFAGAWEKPLHSAVKRNEYETSTRLLELGAQVDERDYYGITPLMIACGRVSSTSVRLLLAHAADPNITNPLWVCPINEFNGKAQMPKYPNFETDRKAFGNTKKADELIALLVCAGIRPQPGNWLQRTSVVIEMSRVSGELLRKASHTVPTLSALAAARCRFLMKAGNEIPRFKKYFEELNVTLDAKEKMKMDVDPY